MITMSGIYMLMTYWYPTYLQEASGASPDLSSWLSGMVLGAGACGCFFGGWLTDLLVRKTGNRRWGRTAQSVVWRGACCLGPARERLCRQHVSVLGPRRPCLLWRAASGAGVVGQRHPG